MMEGAGLLDGAHFLCLDVSKSVQRIAERIDDPAEHFFPDRHLDGFSCRIDKVAVTDFVLSRKEHGAYAVLFEIECKGMVSALDFEKLVVFYVTEPRYMDDPVARIG